MLRDDEGAWRKITLNVRTGKLQGNITFGTTGDFWRLKAAVQRLHLKVIENSRSKNWMWTACNTQYEWHSIDFWWCVRNVFQGEIQLSCKHSNKAKLNNNPKIIIVKHFIIELMHNIQYVDTIKIIKYFKSSPTCFGSQRIHRQGALYSTWLKITRMILSCRWHGQDRCYGSILWLIR